jgi:hypothetical protein
MAEKENKPPKKENKIYLDVTPIEFERVLAKYGMKKREYALSHNHRPAWWYTVLCRRRFLTVADIRTFTNIAGADTFDILLAEVRREKENNSIKQ